MNVEDAERIERTKRLRGWILQLLVLAPTGEETDGGRCWTDSDFLLLQIRKATSWPLLREHVEREAAYLTQKKLVEIKRMKGIAAAIMTGAIGVRLVAAGQDLLDGTTSDPGIDLGSAAS